MAANTWIQRVSRFSHSETLTATIGGIAIGAEEQRHMIVRCRVAHDEIDRHSGIERLDAAGTEVLPDVEGEAITAGAPGHGGRQERRDSAIPVGHRLRQVHPRRTALTLQLYSDGNGRTADRRVEYVGGNGHPSSFSSRSLVIRRCSPAATRNSLPGSFVNRSRSIPRISGAGLPAAQTMNTYPNRA